MPRITSVESLGCPPLRAITTDILGLVKGNRRLILPRLTFPSAAGVVLTVPPPFFVRAQSSRPALGRRASPRS